MKSGDLLCLAVERRGCAAAAQRPYVIRLMSQAGSQAWAFYREVAETRVVWTVRDDEGYPAPKNSSGQRAQPFWSSRSRVEKIIATVPAYSVFRPDEISWEDFCAKWVPRLERDGMLAGVNWSGPHATGFDLEPSVVQRAVEALIAEEGLYVNNRLSKFGAEG